MVAEPFLRPYSRRSPYSWDVTTDRSQQTQSAPPLTLRSGGLDRMLQPGPDYLIGRDPDCDVAIDDPRVSWRHAALRASDGRWVLTDAGSANGTYLGQRRVSRIEIDGECLLRLGHPSAGLALSCSVAAATPATPTRQRSVAHPVPARTVRIGRAPDNDIVIEQTAVSRYHAELRSIGGGLQIADVGSTHGTFVNGQRVSAAALADGDFVGIGPATFRVAGRELQEYADPGPAGAPLPAAGADASEGTLEIPYAVRWLVPRGERFANFDLLNDNDTQLDYYRRFGHIYAVGIPTKKWRLVVVSDPELLDQVASDEEQFGKRIEEINFFTQLANSRGTGISVIGDGEHYESIRRVMLPWYAPSHQRTQLPRMQEQARRLVAAWESIPDDEPVDARNWMERYALEVSGRGACSYDFGLLDAARGDPHPFAAAVPESTKESIARVAEPRPDFTLFASRARRARTRRYREHNSELFATAGALVRGRQHTCPLGQQTDLLSRLVSTPDPQTGELLAADTVRDQILMHLSNGFNGPSITGAWLAYLLATHPDVEDRVIAEIDGITGGDPDYDLTYDDLLSLTYTTQVIKETLRIYPPQPVSIRRSLKDGTLGRYLIRKDDIILVGTLAAQRDPRYWGPEPDTFDPGQFAPDKVAGRPRHAFIPFSVGKRQCMAQEVTFMMLRVILCVIYTHYRLRLAPGTVVAKNTIVTTKPVAVPVVRLPREVTARPRPARPEPASQPATARDPGWGPPTEIPRTSGLGHLVIGYGSNFGACKDLAVRFGERSRYHGYTADVLTLNELASAPPREQPWLLVVMTSTYTSNPPANAAAFKSWLQGSQAGAPTWRNCRYLVWGLGNSQWNAFLAFPRYVHAKLTELGATALADFSFADVGTPAWERQHADWNSRIWPVLLDLSGARPTKAAADRDAAERASASTLTRADSTTAMHRSLAAAPSLTSMSAVQRRALLVPNILTNAAGLRTVQARVLACTELQSARSPKRTRHIELSLPPGVTYWAGDHLGVCPLNDEDTVERLAQRLGAGLDGLFTVPETMTAAAVPKGTVLQVRNVLTNLVDLAGPPPAALTDLLLAKSAGQSGRSRPGGAYDVLALLEEFADCPLNLFEFLSAAQPLRPRYYSISSSPRIHGEGIAHLTVGMAVTSVPGARGREFAGMSARYLHNVKVGDRLNVFLDSAAGFHLQDDPAKPMIFVSAGTGVAPMRAFLWERQAMLRKGAALGEAALFNGIRSPGLDYIYRGEIERFAAEGVLDHVHIAASRQQPGRRDYVQDQIIGQGALIWRLLLAGGYVYVCGSQAMREAVRTAFAGVAAEHGSLSGEQAAAYLAELEATARYRPDLWG